jgi:hypothetical protein
MCPSAVVILHRSAIRAQVAHPTQATPRAAWAAASRARRGATSRRRKAITDQGLSVEEYDSILEVAQNDPEVREKIRQRIRPSAK